MPAPRASPALRARRAPRGRRSVLISCQPLQEGEIDARTLYRSSESSCWNIGGMGNMGEQAVERVGLVAGEAGQALGGAVGAGQAEDLLGQAEQASVEAHAVGGCPFTVAADHAAARGGEIGGVAVGDWAAAFDAAAQFG